MSGFSTREDADLTSGRGVGMSVVCSTIEELAGSLSLQTVPGRGTQFTISLPITLVILDAFLVLAGGYRLAMPQSGVHEIIAVDRSEFRTLGNHTSIPYRGGDLPLLTVAELLRFRADGGAGLPDSRPDRAHVLIIGNEAGSMGLVVDKVTGQREIVVRSISDPQAQDPRHYRSHGTRRRQARPDRRCRSSGEDRRRGKKQGHESPMTAADSYIVFEVRAPATRFTATACCKLK